LRPWIEILRDEGLTEIEIACEFARIRRLAHEECLGVIEREELPDGSA
jgi:hypothetical protein